MTIDLAKLEAVTTIVTHANCMDGLASAMILLDVLPSAKIVFCQYNTPDYLNLPATPNMLFCDITPPRDRAAEFVTAGSIVLDHHKTAKDIVLMFGANGVFGDEIANPGISGAMLAYQQVWVPLISSSPRTGNLTPEQATARQQAANAYNQAVSVAMATKLAAGQDKVAAQAEIDADPTLQALHVAMTSPVGVYAERVAKFATLAGVRDTWQTASPDWQAALKQHLVLNFFPPETWLVPNNVFHINDPQTWAIRMGMGDLLLSMEVAKTAKAVEGSFRFTSAKGVRCVVFAGTHTTSDAAELLGQQADLVMGWAYFVEQAADTVGWPGSGVGPKMVVSCRSRGDFDASALAKTFGGGGHTKAAGFSVRVGANDPNPYIFLKNLIDGYTPA